MKVENVTAQCIESQCDWEVTGDLYLQEREFMGIAMEGGLIDECRGHHLTERTHIHHNRFNFIVNGEVHGFAAVSSEVHTGYFSSERVFKGFEKS